jgi:prefoldin subunit 5
MNITRQRIATGFAAALTLLAFAAPAAEAAKKKIDGQLIAAADSRGSKVEAPVLLSEKSAKRLKLDSPIATLSLKGSMQIAAPNPAGSGAVLIAPETLRAGDSVKGKGKVKGKRSALMPTVKAGKVEVTDRESAYSVDELTGALVALYNQGGVLGLRVDSIELALAELRAELEALKAENANLQDQIDALLAQIAGLETALDDLTDIVNGLPTEEDLQGVIDEIDQLRNDLTALQALVGTLPTDTDITNLQNQIDTLSSELSTLETTVGDLGDDVAFLCGMVPLPGSCP